MRSLLSYVSEVGATIIADVDAAFTFDKVVVIGDPDDGRVEAALNRLRGWGIAPITDIRQLGGPSADKGVGFVRSSARGCASSDVAN